MQVTKLMSTVETADILIGPSGARYLVLENALGIVSFRQRPGDRVYTYDWAFDGDKEVTVSQPVKLSGFKKKTFPEPKGWEDMTVEHFLGLIGA